MSMVYVSRVHIGDIGWLGCIHSFTAPRLLGTCRNAFDTLSVRARDDAVTTRTGRGSSEEREAVAGDVRADQRCAGGRGCAPVACLHGAPGQHGVRVDGRLVPRVTWEFTTQSVLVEHGAEQPHVAGPACTQSSSTGAVASWCCQSIVAVADWCYQSVGASQVMTAVDLGRG